MQERSIVIKIQYISRGMKKEVVQFLCHAPIFGCCVRAVTSCTKQTSNDIGTVVAAKNRVSFSFPDNLLMIRAAAKEQPPREQESREYYSGSLIDAAASFVSTRSNHQYARRSVIVGTIFGHRRGRVSFCVQRDDSLLPPFLFELSVLTESLASEMSSGRLRVALECRRSTTTTTTTNIKTNVNTNTNTSSSCNVWKAYCNGRDVGLAVRRRPTDKDRFILESLRTTTAGVGSLPIEAMEGTGGDVVMYMRATYERVVDSKDAVSYHLIDPCSSTPQELSVSLLRARLN